MKKPLSAKEVDAIVVSQADDYSKWGRANLCKTKETLIESENR